MGEVCTNHGECGRAAEPPASNPYPVAGGEGDGRQRHDGFFLRLTLGAGGGAVGFDVPAGDDTAFAGGGWASSLDLGGALDDDITFFGRARIASLVSPAVSIDGDELGPASDAIATQSMLGVGISYYVMPLNLYFDGVVGVAVIASGYDYAGDDRDYESDIGFGFDLDVGKEWWVSDNWGLGAAVRLSITRVEGSDDLPDDSELGAVFVSLLLSATYQ